MSIGRNHPCPCGSRRKYKHCHGAWQSAGALPREAARAKTLKELDIKLHERLMRFARLRYGPDWLQDGLDSTWLFDEAIPPDADVPIVIPWLLFFKASEPSGLTLAQVWRDHERRRISPDEGLLLDAYDAAWLSLWEVVGVERGVGSHLTDVLTREERFVRDVSSTSTLRRFDTVLAIVVTVDDVSFFGGVHAQPLPPRPADVVAREARRMCRVRTRPVAAEKLRDAELQLELLAVWDEVVGEIVDQPPPVIHNTDGDPFVFTTDHFALLVPRDEVAPRLALLAGVEEAERQGDDTVFVAMKPGNAMHRSWENTIIGRMVLSKERLTIETNSSRRADALRSKVEERLHGLVRFRVGKEANTDELLADAHASAGSRPGHLHDLLPAEEASLVREFRERHMRDWLDDAIPALGGLTPREAARLPRARPKLEILLKEFEQTEATLPEQQRIDLGSLRQALGMS